MADNRELNPGQRHYQDLSNGRNGALAVMDKDNDTSQTDYSDYNNYSSPTDYSEPKSQFSQRYKNDTQFTGNNTSGSKYNDYPTSDYNKSSQDYLNQGERASLSYSSHKNTDLSRQENDASHQTSGFDSASRKRTLNKAEKRGLRTKIVVTGLALISGVALFMTGFTALSGPLQFVQVANIARDFVLNISDDQKQARSVSNSRSIARLFNKGGTAEERKMNNRVGLLARAQSEAQTTRLASKGISFSTDGNGYYAGMDIDMKKYLGTDNPTESQIRKIAQEMDIGDKFSVNGSTLKIDSNLSYSEMKRSIKVLDDPGKWSVRSWMQTRATLKRQGFTSWLHPFQKLKNAADKQIHNLISKVMGNGDSTKNRSRSAKDDDDAQKNISDKNEGLEDGNKIDTNAAKNAGDDLIDAGTDVADEITESGGDTVRRGILGAAKNVQDQFSGFLTANPVKVVRLLISIMCVIRDLTNNAGPYKMAAIANIAEKGTSIILGIASQVMSGEDITMDDLGDSAEQMFYATIQLLTVDGKETGETTQSSFQTAPEVSCTLGTNCTEPTSSDLTSELSAVDDAANITGDPNMNNAITAVLDDASLSGIITGGLCIANDVLGFIDGLTDIAGAIFDLFTSALLDSNEMIGSFISKGINILYGKPIDLASATPRQWGSIFMFGALFMSNDQSILSGGRKMTNRQSYELNLENRRYLAWENGRKSLMARLFDPSDYNSSISQIARSIQIDTSNQSFTTQLANVFKLFNSAPTIIANASSQLLGGSAYAAAAYDYGVPTYAWSLDDMNNLVAGGEEYDMIENAYEVTTMLKKEDDALKSNPIADIPLHNYAEKCLTVKIGNEGSAFKVTAIDNENGEAWNYVDNATNNASNCNDLSQLEEYKKLSLYVMDYFNTVSGMCYEGDASDNEANSACNEMGVDTSGMSSIGSSSFSENAETMIAQFESDTGNSGDWDGAFGRQCVDLSVWFLDNYTTLTHASDHGKGFVTAVANANGLQATDTPEAPAFFSATCDVPALTENCEYGHTGVVLKVDEDGTIHTIENGNSSGSYSRTFTPDQYAGTLFLNVGDYLK